MERLRQTFEIGALLRRSFRRTCLELGVDYTEEKGWLDSFFVVEGTREQIVRLNNYLDYINAAG